MPATRRDSDAGRLIRPKAAATEPRPIPEGDRVESLLRGRYRLTPSESQVARYVADGLKYSEIAGILGVSYHTVHSHVKAIHAKTGVPSNGRLMVLIRDELRP